MANTRDVMGEAACLDALVAKTLTSFEDSDVTIVGQSAFKNHTALVEITLPNATTIRNYGVNGCISLQEFYGPSVNEIGNYAFRNDTSLKRVILGNVSTIIDYAFQDCMNLTELAIENVAQINQYAFSDCKRIYSGTIDLSDVTSIGSYAFGGTGIGKLDLPSCRTVGNYAISQARTGIVDLGAENPNINTNAFNGGKFLCHLLMRGVTSVININSTSAFSGTPLASGLGWIYVPESLVDSYKNDSKWSTMAAQIASTSEYPKAMQDETITDSWSTIIASSSYATDYPIGGVKYLDVGGTQLAMVLVATDADDLTSGGKARMTWVSRDILELQRMDMDNNTDAIWSSCHLRTWLMDVIYPQIDQTVRSAIKEVTKTYYEHGTTSDRTTSDVVWIPSYREVFGDTVSSQYEKSGCDYTSVFNDATSRTKIQGIVGSRQSWYLRSGSGAYENRFMCISTQGTSNDSQNKTLDDGVVIGFCI